MFCMISTYSSVEVDSVLARNDIGDGRAAALLARLDVGGHGCSTEEMNGLVSSFTARRLKRDLSILTEG